MGAELPPNAVQIVPWAFLNNINTNQWLYPPLYLALNTITAMNEFHSRKLTINGGKYSLGDNNFDFSKIKVLKLLMLLWFLNVLLSVVVLMVVILLYMLFKFQDYVLYALKCNKNHDLNFCCCFLIFCHL